MAITINGPIEVRAPYPIDLRSVYATIADRNAFSTADDYVYKGALAYVVGEQKLYIYIGNGPAADESTNWIEVGTGSFDPNTINHNELDGLQGGSNDDLELYHTTAASYQALMESSNPSAENPYATIGDLTIYGLTKVVDTVADMILWTTATEGDRTIVTNNVSDPAKNGEWIALQDNPTTEAHWLLLPNQNTVISVAGKVGVVTLQKANITDWEDITVDSLVHNLNNVTPVDGMQWVYDSTSNGGEMILSLEGGGGLSAPLTSTVSVGGISPGNSWPTGTSIEAILRKMLEKASIYSLNFTGTNNSSTVYTGTVVTADIFSWGTSGAPTGLTLSDGASMTNVPVTTSPYDHPSSLTYTKSTRASVLWTLNGSNVSPTYKRITWLEPSYWGIYPLGDPAPVEAPLAEDILGGNKVKKDTSSGAHVFDIVQGSKEMFWIAVESAQSATMTWFQIGDSDVNKAAIGGLNDYDTQIRYLGTQTVDNGTGPKTYEVFGSSYESVLSSGVRLAPYEL